MPGRVLANTSTGTLTRSGKQILCWRFRPGDHERSSPDHESSWSSRLESVRLEAADVGLVGVDFLRESGRGGPKTLPPVCASVASIICLSRAPSCSGRVPAFVSVGAE